jgi:hypothetical protein
MADSFNEDATDVRRVTSWEEVYDYVARWLYGEISWWRKDARFRWFWSIY